VDCEVVCVVEWVVYEHAQALQPFDVEQGQVGGGPPRSREASHWKMGG
jgi:hypothetical protein